MRGHTIGAKASSLGQTVGVVVVSCPWDVSNSSLPGLDVSLGGDHQSSSLELLGAEKWGGRTSLATERPARPINRVLRGEGKMGAVQGGAV